MRWAILLACASGALLAPLGARADRASVKATAKKPAADTVAIAAGCVTVGPAEEHGDLAPRKVCLKAFRIDRTEVTVAQHRACVAAGACKPPPKSDPLCNANAGDGGRDQHPANCATYEEAVRFCKWRGARLPSPDEWERAARGPKMTLYPWGAQAPTQELVAFPRLAGDGAHRRDLTTEPVCAHPSGNSAEGACDLAGNVSEWVAGYFADRGPVPSHPGAALGPFGKGVELDGSRWSRGGSFASPAASLQSWDADEADLDERPDAKRGFRCATGG